MPPLSVAERGYPHPELLTDTEWLAAHLSDPTLRIVDARTDEDYAAELVNGAGRVGVARRTDQFGCGR